MDTSITQNMTSQNIYREDASKEEVSQLAAPPSPPPSLPP